MKNRIICLILALGLSATAFSQKIRTVAGNNVQGYSGDGGAAIHAMIGASWGIAMDRKGNLFVADDDINIIRKVTPGGIISTIAGTGYPGYSGDGYAATGAKLNYPSGLSVDKWGNLYFADNGNFCIRKVDTSGVISTVVGDGSGARGNAGDGGLAIAARLAGCVSITFDRNEQMYIADGNGRIRKVDNSGIITSVAGSSALGYTGDGGPATAATLDGVSGVAVDSLGNIYISDQLNNVIRKVNSAGKISTIAGRGVSGFNGDGGLAINALISAPGGIVTDKTGNIYFADENNNRVRKISISGTITTVVGNGAWGYSGDGRIATLANMKMSTALCFSNSGNLFMTDRINYVVRELVNVDAVKISADPGNIIVQGAPVTFTVPAGGNDFGLSYEWQKNGIDVGTDSRTYIPASISNGDIITCTLNDPSTGLPLTLSDTIKMLVMPLGVKYLQPYNVSINMQMSPNPNHGTFEFSAKIDALIDDYVFYGVYDISGHMVMEGSGFSLNGQIKESIVLPASIIPGIYTLLLSSGNAKSLSRFEILQ